MSEPALMVSSHAEELDLGQPQAGQAAVGHTSTGKELGCLSCHMTFSGREEQVQHYKLDWHRYNIKRKLKGLEPVDQDHFEKISGGCVGKGSSVVVVT